VNKRARFVVDDLGRLQCLGCARWLPATTALFPAARSSRLGITGTCRECTRVYLAAWRSAKGEALRARRRELHQERWKPRAKARYDALREAAPAKHRAQLLRTGMRERAKELGLPFASAVFTAAYIASWLRSQRTCECCDRVLRLGVRGSFSVKCDASPSIDRFVPSLGYVPGNVYLLCWRCNNLKRDASASELRRIADWMDRVSKPASNAVLDLPLAPSRSV
jgi:hypothetical protein